MITTILFDLDGVLVEAKDWHFEALNLALKHVCDYEISYEDHLSRFDGLPSRKKLIKLASMGIVEKHQFDQIFDLKQKYTLQIISEKCRPDPEKIEMMEQLHNYKKACITNSIYKTAYQMLVLSGLNPFLEYVQGNEATLFPKPNPAPYLFAMSHLGVKPEETLIIEDNENGYKSALDSRAFVMKVDNYKEVNFDNINFFLRGINK
jgi:beta-phosphoglucomutase